MKWLKFDLDLPEGQKTRPDSDYSIFRKRIGTQTVLPLTAGKPTPNLFTPFPERPMIVYRQFIHRFPKYSASIPCSCVGTQALVALPLNDENAEYDGKDVCGMTLVVVPTRQILTPRINPHNKTISHHNGGEQ